MLHAALSPKPGDRMVIVLDSEYAYKGITVWAEKWRRHGWRTSSGEVGHRDLWEHIFWLREGAGDLLQLRWVPSHLNVEGNEEADALACQGREQHPNNLLPLSKRRRVTEWEDLGLQPMVELDQSLVSLVCSDVDSGGGVLVTAHTSPYGGSSSEEDMASGEEEMQPGFRQG